MGGAQKNITAIDAPQLSVQISKAAVKAIISGAIAIYAIVAV